MRLMKVLFVLDISSFVFEVVSYYEALTLNLQPNPTQTYSEIPPSTSQILRLQIYTHHGTQLL